MRHVGSLIYPAVLFALTPASGCAGAAVRASTGDAATSVSDASSESSFCTDGCIDKDGSCYTGGIDNAHCGGSPGSACVDCGANLHCFSDIDFAPGCVSRNPPLGNSSSSGGSGSSPIDAGGPNLCPMFNNQPTCLARNGCDLSLGTNCGADALPQGLLCNGPDPQCQAKIGPVDGCGRVDGWICTCVNWAWSCTDCAVGAASCEGGTGAYDLPDASDQ